MEIPATYGELYDELKYGMIGNGTHAILTSWITEDYLALGRP